MSSTKTNILLNALNTVTAILFPVITFPYAARVLMPEGIGTVDFLNSIVNYIVLLTNIGIPLYALKEVAKYREDKPMRDKITLEVLGLSLCMCVFGYLIVWILAEFVPVIHKDASLFFILSLSIVFTLIGINWFYQGIEDFKFITKRAIIVRIIAAVALFVFVKTPADLIPYCFIIVGSTVGNNIINLLNLRKHIDIRTIDIRNLNIWRHLKPALVVFTLNLIISLYSYTTTIILGIISSEEQVGFFTAGSKISLVAVTLISSISYVLIPRSSHLIGTGDVKRFGELTTKALRLIICLSLPMIAGIWILSTPLTLVFCGPEYGSSIPVLIINAPVILFSNLNLLLSLQTLYPLDKVNTCLAAMSIGAIVNIFLNFILDSQMGAIGAAVSKTSTELVIMVMIVALGEKYFPFKIGVLLQSKYLLATIVMSVVVYFAISPFSGHIWKICIGSLSGVIAYLISLICLKDSLTMQLFGVVKNRFVKS